MDDYVGLIVNQKQRRVEDLQGPEIEVNSGNEISDSFAETPSGTECNDLFAGTPTGNERNESFAETPSTETSAGNLLDNPNLSSEGPFIPKFDIGLFVNKSAISDADKYQLLKEPWTPDHKHEFPKKKEGQQYRSFNRKSLFQPDGKLHEWLSYSHIMDGAFCRVCVLCLVNKESVGNGGNNEAGILVMQPMTLWKVSVLIIPKSM